MFKYDHKLIAEEYLSGKSVREIMDIYSCCDVTVYECIHEYNIELRKEYNFNVEYFDTIDTENKAYWLGFITADGSIDSSGHISIGLQSGDREHLIKLSEDIEFALPHIPILDVMVKDKLYKKAEFIFGSVHMAKTLVSYGVVPNKTGQCYPAFIPEVVPYELERHYWRGLVDGDGWVSICKRDNLIVLGLVGDLDICDGFADYCKRNSNKFRSNVSRHSSIYKIKMEGGAAEEMSHLLYDDCYRYLDRKYQNFMDYISLEVKGRRKLPQNFYGGPALPFVNPGSTKQ